MKLGTVTKLDKRNKTTSKNFDDDIMSENCDVSSFFQYMTYLEQSGSWIPGRIVCKT